MSYTDRMATNFISSVLTGASSLLDIGGTRAMRRRRDHTGAASRALYRSWRSVFSPFATLVHEQADKDGLREGEGLTRVSLNDTVFLLQIINDHAKKAEVIISRAKSTENMQEKAYLYAEAKHIIALVNQEMSFVNSHGMWKMETIRASLQYEDLMVQYSRLTAEVGRLQFA